MRNYLTKQENSYKHSYDKIHFVSLFKFLLIKVTSLFGVLHNSNSLIRLFSIFSIMVKYLCLCTPDVHINDANQWIEICNPYACVQRFTLNDHIKHTSLVPLNSVIYVNILGIVTPMSSTLNDHYNAHKSGFIDYCHSCEHFGNTNMEISPLD